MEPSNPLPAPLPSELIANELLNKELNFAWNAKPPFEDANATKFFSLFNSVVLSLLHLMNRCHLPGLSPLAIVLAREYKWALDNVSPPRLSGIDEALSSFLNSGRSQDLQHYKIIDFGEEEDERITPWWQGLGEPVFCSELSSEYWKANDIASR